MNHLDPFFERLIEIYKEMPSAVGCVGCGRCCKVQHPHAFYIEFLYMYRYIRKEWTKKELIDLFVNCILHYLDNSLNKVCVFLDSNNRCRIYDYRDFNCRAFGIIPKKVYAERVKKVKKDFGGIRLGLEKLSDCRGHVKPEKFIGKKKDRRIVQSHLAT